MTDTKRNQDRVHAASPMLAGLNKGKNDDKSKDRRSGSSSIPGLMDKINESQKPVEDAKAPTADNEASKSGTTHGDKTENGTTHGAKNGESENGTTHGAKNKVEKSKPKKAEGSTEIKMSEITPWGFADRPEDEFGDDEEWAEFVNSIKYEGVDQPVTVRKKKNGKGYELICGRRRFLASNEVGNETIPCLIRSLSDVEAAALQDRENSQRKDLSTYAKAMSWQHLLDAGIFTKTSHLAAAFNVDRKYVNKILVYTRIPKEVMESITAKKNISITLAQELVNQTRESDDQPKAAVKKNIEAIKAFAPKISEGGITPTKLKAFISKFKSDDETKVESDTYSKELGVVDGTRYFTVRKDSNGTPTISILKEARELMSVEDIAQFMAELISDNKKG
ncbi:ParB/RepB/Spo0J family partition protein [Vibrio owensii]|uniref:ParB/RepB/Spo0J family partition protein n=1 Tax=Vibrio owensii TaxID=696485 RepID=UPI00339083B4